MRIVIVAGALALLPAETSAEQDLNGANRKQSTIDAIRATFEDGGIEFIAQNGGGHGARLR